MTPAAIMNDGLFDISIYNQVMTFKRIYTEVQSVLIERGTHAYENDWQHVRGK